jgi:benzil reductase ((S)-benzoin forming)
MHAAIVTGVSRGLGKALAAALLERGFTVMGVGRASPADLQGTYEFVRFDLAQAGETDERLTAAFSGLASRKPESVCLINNAAIAAPVGTLGRLDAREIASSLAVNLASVVALANLFCRVFIDASIRRRIINVSSGAAQNVLPGDSVYCVAKAGLEMLTRTLAGEQKDESFRAITVRPGVIDTDMQTFARSQSPDVLPSVELFKGFHRDGRLVKPDVVAAKIVDKLVAGDVEHGRTYSYQEL